MSGPAIGAVTLKIIEATYWSDTSTVHGPYESTAGALEAAVITTSPAVVTVKPYPAGSGGVIFAVSPMAPVAIVTVDPIDIASV